MASPTIEVYADISCPFAHVGLRRFVDARRRLGRSTPRLVLRAWPLELVNGVPLSGAEVAPKIEALRAAVAPALFEGFDARRFPTTTLPALAAEAAARRTSAETGEAFALAVRDALFERGLDVADPDVLGDLRSTYGVPEPGLFDRADVEDDLHIGRARGVRGSPHFFYDGAEFFCASLRISHIGQRYDIGVDLEGLAAFEQTVFGCSTGEPR